jgi:hypothetical protein
VTGGHLGDFPQTLTQRRRGAGRVRDRRRHRTSIAGDDTGDGPGTTTTGRCAPCVTR